MQFPIFLEPVRAGNGDRTYRVEVPAFPGETTVAESIDAAIQAGKALVTQKLRELYASGSAAPTIHDSMPELERLLRAPNRLLHVVGIETFRRARGSDTWHGCRNCDDWPQPPFDEAIDPPADGEICNECRALQARGACQT